MVYSFEWEKNGKKASAILCEGSSGDTMCGLFVIVCVVSSIVLFLCVFASYDTRA